MFKLQIFKDTFEKLDKPGIHLVHGKHGSGRSTFMLNLFLDIMQNNTRKCMFMPVEMYAEDIMKMLISNLTGIDYFRIKTNDLTIPEREKIKAYMDPNNIKFSGVIHEPTGTLSEVEKFLKENPDAVIFIDSYDILETQKITEEVKSIEFLESNYTEYRINKLIREYPEVTFILCTQDKSDERSLRTYQKPRSESFNNKIRTRTTIERISPDNHEVILSLTEIFNYDIDFTIRRMSQKTV